MISKASLCWEYEESQFPALPSHLSPVAAHKREVTLEPLASGDKSGDALLILPKLLGT